MMSSAPDVCEHKLERASDTWLILACDGVWDVLSDQQVCDVVKHHASAKSAAEVSQGVPCQSTLRSRATLILAVIRANPFESIVHCLRCRPCVSKRTAVAAPTTSLAALCSLQTRRRIPIQAAEPRVKTAPMWRWHSNGRLFRAPRWRPLCTRHSTLRMHIRTRANLTNCERLVL